MPYRRRVKGGPSPPSSAKSGAAGSRQRARRHDTAIGGSSTRQQPATGSRQSSPDKRHVSFDQRLERGPTPSDPHKRSNQSPSRSALAKPHEESMSAMADEQLALEAQQAAASAGGHGDCHSPGTACVDESSKGRGSYAQAYIKFKQARGGVRLVKIATEEDRDQEVCRRIHELRADIVNFAQTFVASTTKRSFNPQDPVIRLCSDAKNAQLIRYIGCLTQGGPDGVRDWQNLLVDASILTALIVGIIGTVLKEHVFSALWFGGTAQQNEELHQMQENQAETDGYYRTQARAMKCAYFRGRATAQTLLDHIAADRKIAIALEKLLTPLFYLKDVEQRGFPEKLKPRLVDIVHNASDMSREMRECGDAIYYWPPTFKDEEFDPKRMECLNIEAMIRESPYKNEVVQGHTRSVLVGAADQSEAIVKVVAFPSLVVHRKGGGDLAKTLLEEERQADRTMPPDVFQSRRRSRDSPFVMTGKEGYRTRLLCKSVVHLMWGRQRLLTREAGTSSHLDAMRDGNEAKYDDDRRGWVELYDHFMETNVVAAAGLL